MKTIELFRLPNIVVHEEGVADYKELISFQVNLPIKAEIMRFILLPEPKNSANSQAPYLVLEVPSQGAFQPTVFHALIDGSAILPNTEYVGTFDTMLTHESEYAIDPPIRYHLYKQKRERKPRVKKTDNAPQN